jgi:hypothetical protein
MDCEVCSKLGVGEAKLGLNQRWIKFVELSALRASSEAADCAECVLIWDAIQIYREEWERNDLSTFLELRMAPGKPLQLIWPKGSAAIALFTRDGVLLVCN